MASLSVKVDYVAALRDNRHPRTPDPSHAAVLAELAGSDGVTCHLREDRIGIRDRDIYILKEIVRTKFTLQIAPVDELMERALEVKPWMVTLMPLDMKDLSATSGIDLEGKADVYSQAAMSLKKAGLNVCYFVNPEADLIKAAARVKVGVVELNVTHYVTAKSLAEAESELERLEQMANLARKLGMSVYCSGGLNYKNIRPVVDLDVFDEFTVGHAIISRSLMVGLERAVREMADIVHRPSEGQ